MKNISSGLGGKIKSMKDILIFQHIKDLQQKNLMLNL